MEQKSSPHATSIRPRLPYLAPLARPPPARGSHLPESVIYIVSRRKRVTFGVRRCDALSIVITNL